MKSSLITFENEIKSITHNIESCRLEAHLIATIIKSSKSKELRPLINYQNHHKKRYSLKRQYDYNSIIISLYGTLENYIESLVKGYVRSINDCTNYYNQLPEAIKKHHLNLSLDLITKINQQNYNGILNSKDIVENLDSCFKNNSYKLNQDAFSLHGANFRKSVIDEMFSRLDIKNISHFCVKQKPFSTFLISQGKEPEKDDPKELFELLDDLVQRRNEVSHGISSSILSYDILDLYTNFIYYFGVSLFKVVYQTFISNYFKRKGKQLGKPNNVLKKGRVILINIADCGINVGDKLIAKNNESTVITNIISIQVDDKSVTTLNQKESQEIGILVDGKISKSHQINLYGKNIP